MHDIVNKYGDVKSIKDEIVNIQNARNKIFYASDDGYPSGFANPREEIRNECKKTLALLWTCVDIHENKMFACDLLNKHSGQLKKLYVNLIKRSLSVNVNIMKLKLSSLNHQS